MQQFTRKPVKVFKSTDTGAPQIGYRTAGDFKTVLKACLNAGYGSKTALGWDIVGEDTNRIAVRSANAASTKSVLWVDDSSGITAEIRAYESMTDLNTGTGKFEYNNAATDKYYCCTSASTSTKAKWLLVGHDAAFFIAIWAGDPRNGATPLLFGDFPSFVQADQYNALLISHLSNSSTNTSVLYGLRTENAFPALKIALSRSSNQTTKSSSMNFAKSLVSMSPYPDPVLGTWVGSHAYIIENGGYRGVIPGLYACGQFQTHEAYDFAEALPAVSNGDVYVWARQREYQNQIRGFVVNATAWLSP